MPSYTMTAAQASAADTAQICSSTPALNGRTAPEAGRQLAGDLHSGAGCQPERESGAPLAAAAPIQGSGCPAGSRQAHSMSASHLSAQQSLAAVAQHPSQAAALMQQQTAVPMHGPISRSEEPPMALTAPLAHAAAASPAATDLQPPVRLLLNAGQQQHRPQPIPSSTPLIAYLQQLFSSRPPTPACQTYPSAVIPLNGTQLQLSNAPRPAPLPHPQLTLSSNSPQQMTSTATLQPRPATGLSQDVVARGQLAQLLHALLGASATRLKPKQTDQQATYNSPAGKAKARPLPSLLPQHTPAWTPAHDLFAPPQQSFSPGPGGGPASGTDCTATLCQGPGQREAADSSTGAPALSADTRLGEGPPQAKRRRTALSSLPVLACWQCEGAAEDAPGAWMPCSVHSLSAAADGHATK